VGPGLVKSASPWGGGVSLVTLSGRATVRPNREGGGEGVGRGLGVAQRRQHAFDRGVQRLRGARKRVGGSGHTSTRERHVRQTNSEESMAPK
jgi:hypothetical protein